MSEEKLSSEDVQEDVNQIETELDTKADATVTTLADAEKESGQPVQMTEEEFVMRAHVDLIAGLQYLRQYWGKLSKRGTLRVMTAILQLPQQKMKNELKGKLEQELFHIGQRITMAKFTIIQKHIIEEAKRLKKEKETEQVKEEVKNESTESKEV